MKRFFKTTFLIFLIVIIFMCGLSYYEYYRYWKKDKFTVNEFDKETFHSLKPIKGKKNNYYLHSIQVEGYVDDTVILYNNIGWYYLIDSIKENYFYDYYTGEKDAFMRIDPYKATEGSLKIIHTIAPDFQWTLSILSKLKLIDS